MFLIDEHPEGGNMPSEQPPAGRQRRKLNPITWVAAVALMPLLVWDVWQTVQDVGHRQASASNGRPPAAARLRAVFD